MIFVEHRTCVWNVAASKKVHSGSTCDFQPYVTVVWVDFGYHYSVLKIHPIYAWHSPLSSPSFGLLCYRVHYIAWYLWYCTSFSFPSLSQHDDMCLSKELICCHSLMPGKPRQFQYITCKGLLVPWAASLYAFVLSTSCVFILLTSSLLIFFSHRAFLVATLFLTSSCCM